MLYEAAIAIPTRIHKNFKLRLWGPRLARKKGLKRAATAVARALAVLLHKIWTSGTTFRFGAGGKRGRVAAAAKGPPRPGRFHVRLLLPPRRNGVTRGDGDLGEIATFLVGGFMPTFEAIKHGAG